MNVATAPIHELGHYVAAKSFGWNITEVGWFSHVAYTQETIDNAPRLQKIIVSVAGVFFAPIMPYILILLIRRSVIRDILALPYLGLGVFAGCADLKKMIWYLLTSAPMISTEDQVLDPMNLVVSTLTAVGIMCVVYMIAKGRYKQCVGELSTVIDELDDHDVEEHKNE